MDTLGRGVLSSEQAIDYFRAYLNKGDDEFPGMAPNRAQRIEEPGEERKKERSSEVFRRKINQDRIVGSKEHGPTVVTWEDLSVMNIAPYEGTQVRMIRLAHDRIPPHDERSAPHTTKYRPTMIGPSRTRPSAGPSVPNLLAGGRSARGCEALPVLGGADVHLLTRTHFWFRIPRRGGGATRAGAMGSTTTTSTRPSWGGAMPATTLCTIWGGGVAGMGAH